MKNQYEDVGIVEEIWRYPVKSFRGEHVNEIRLGWHGLVGDRRFSFVRTAITTGFPWLSARRLPELVRYKTRENAIADSEKSEVIVTAPSGIDYPIKSPELLVEIKELYRGEIQLMQLFQGIFDSMSVSLITTESIRQVSIAVGLGLEVERFRPNLVIKALGERRFPEDKWVGKQLAFGNGPDPARIYVARKDARCMVVNIHPETGQRQPEILKEIVKSRRNFLGAYGSTYRPGSIRVGDVVRLLNN